MSTLYLTHISLILHIIVLLLGIFVVDLMFLLIDLMLWLWICCESGIHMFDHALSFIISLIYLCEHWVNCYQALCDLNHLSMIKNVSRSFMSILLIMHHIKICSLSLCLDPWGRPADIAYRSDGVMANPRWKLVPLRGKLYILGQHRLMDTNRCISAEATYVEIACSRWHYLSCSTVESWCAHMAPSQIVLMCATVSSDS